MTRYRTVHCLIWNDDKFPFVSDDCQLVWFHILTTPFSTPFGLFKTTIEMLASEKRWPVKRYAKAFKEGLQEGFFKYNENRQLIYIPKHICYNPPHNPNVLKSWGKIYNELPNCDLKQEFYQSLMAFLEQYGKGFAKSFAESFSKSMLNDPDPVTVTVTDLSSKKNVKKEKTTKKKYRDSVMLEDKEYEKLVEEFGEKRTQSLIEDLDNYMGSHGKTYKWHYKAILGFAKREDNKKGGNGKDKLNPLDCGRPIREMSASDIERYDRIILERVGVDEFEEIMNDDGRRHVEYNKIAEEDMEYSAKLARGEIDG